MRISLALLILIWACQIQAQLMIEIKEGIDNPTPIAVVPFGRHVKGEPFQDVADIVRSDLSRTGLFSLLAKGDMLSRPEQPFEVYYRDWRALNQDYVIIGKVTRNKADTNLLTIEYHLIDVVRQQQLLSKKMLANNNALRDVAHRISDQIFEKLTNIPGAFSTKILYVSSEHPKQGKAIYRLWVADADGARARVILESLEPILSPAWSPDGKQIAYVSFEDKRPAIFKQDIASGKRQKLTNFKGLNGSPSWSPDGKKLAMVLSKDGSPSIYIMDLASQQLKMVGSHRFAIDTEPQWMPDGKSLIFTSNRGGGPQIYQYTLASGKVSRVTFEGRYNARGRPIPDGSGIVMVHQNEKNFHIARLDFSTGRVRLLTNTRLDESPSIAANGSMIMYATKRNNEGVLAAVSIDGRISFILPSKGEEVREPAWSPFFNN